MRSGEAAREPLKIGILAGSRELPRWIQHILRSIREDPGLELRLFVVDATPPGPPRSLVRKLRDASPWALYLLYERLDRAYFATPNDPLRIVDVAAELEGVEVLEVVPIAKRFVHRFAAEDLERIAAHDLDVILRFGFNILKGPILEAARYGVWSYHHDDNREYRGGPPLFHEIREGNPRSGTILQSLTEKLDAGKVLYRSISATDLISLQRNREQNYWKTAEFIPRRLRQLRERGWDSITSLPEYREKLDYDRGLFRRPKNAAMLAYLGTLARRVASNFWANRRYKNQWVIGVRELDGPEFRAPHAQAYRPITPPHDHFYADPFPIEVGGRRVIFFEDRDDARGKAHISCCELDAEGRPGAIETALVRDYHLSYPFVFKRDGEVWMIPETSENRSVELYRATDFPTRWELEKVLFEQVSAVDATLHEHNGRLWLFMNMSVSGGDPNDELFLFSAEHLLGPWTAHPSNPIVSDVTRARPAGSLFHDGTGLVRPSQDSAELYGSAFRLNRVEVLTMSEYRESEICRVGPDWQPGAIGTHTLSRSESLEAIDWKLRVRRR